MAKTPENLEALIKNFPEHGDDGKEKKVFNFVLETIREIRHKTAREYLTPQEINYALPAEVVSLVLREKTQELMRARTKTTSVLDHRYSYFNPNEPSEYENFFHPFYKVLVHKLLEVDDGFQIEILDRRAGGKGKYLEFLRKMAEEVEKILNADLIAGRGVVKIEGELNDINFNKLKAPGRYGGIEIINSYLKDLFKTILVMQREEYRMLVQSVLDEDVTNPAAQLFEEILFGKEKTTFLRKVRSWFSKGNLSSEKPKRKNDSFFDSSEISLE